MKFVEAANNFKKLAEMRKYFAKFLKFASNLTKFVSLANNFYEGRRSCKQLCKVLPITFGKSVRPGKNFMKFADWKVGFKCLKVFLYLSFTRSNILVRKHVL